MLKTTTTSTKKVQSSRQTVKSLSSTLPTAESKTPESEKSASPSRKTQKQKAPTQKSGVKLVSRSKSAKDADEKSESKEITIKKSPLSKRAQKVKYELGKKDIVSAVVLKANGESEEIKYDTTSHSVNKILSGRPTIIGELEEISVIIVRSLNTRNKCINKHVLPVPFCNKSYDGDYLLYRVDSSGNALNLTLKEYTRFVERNSKLTEQARKNYNPIENQEITKKSGRNSQSKLMFILLRSEADRKVRTEFKEKFGRNATESEVEESVNKTLEKLINDLVNNSSSSPMNDPDYNPDDEKNNDVKERKNIIKKVYDIYKLENNNKKLKDKDFKKNLKAIKKQFVINVNEEDDDKNDSDYNPDDDGDEDVSEYSYSSELNETDWRSRLNEALNYVRERGRSDGRILANKISETFYELNGKEPSLNELIDIFRRIRTELSDEAQRDILINSPDNGSAYYLAKKLGPQLSSADPSELVEYAKRIVGEDLVSRAKSAFIISKGRSPNKFELEKSVNKLSKKLGDDAIKQSANNKLVDTVINNDDDEEDVDADYDPNNKDDIKQKYKDDIENEQFDSDYFNLRMLASTIRKSETAQKYDVYFCNFSEKEEKINFNRAIKAFKKRNKREPNAFEIRNLQNFLKTDKNTSLVEFKLAVVSDNDDKSVNEEEKNVILEESSANIRKQKAQTTPSKILVTPIKKKKTSARYDLYLDNEFDANKNHKIALKWFKRFNNRKPTKKEEENISRFVKADKSGLTVCNFDVLIDSDDDVKETEEDDIIIKTKTSNVVNKGNATKYTLNFDDGDNKERDNKNSGGDTKQAIKWFKRFNNREPSKNEKLKIQKFIKADKIANDNNEQKIVVEDTIDID